MPRRAPVMPGRHPEGSCGETRPPSLLRLRRRRVRRLGARLAAAADREQHRHTLLVLGVLGVRGDPVALLAQTGCISRFR